MNIKNLGEQVIFVVALFSDKSCSSYVTSFDLGLFLFLTFNNLFMVLMELLNEFIDTMS